MVTLRRDSCMKFHTIAGLPRSGSTLLQRILAQNPGFFCSSTSPLSGVLAQTSLMLSELDEVKGMLASDRERTEGRVLQALRGFVHGWYPTQQAKVVFDKGRGWCHNAALLGALFPQAKILVTVRDPRAVFSSIEKGNANTPLFSLAKTPHEKSAIGRYRQMFDHGGLVGTCIDGVEDLLRRGDDRAFYVEYEDLCTEPEETVQAIYEFLDEPWYKKHNFKKILNTAEDVDAMWLHKFEHQGPEAIQPPAPWQENCPPDIAADIMQRFNGFNQAFGYS